MAKKKSQATSTARSAGRVAHKAARERIDAMNGVQLRAFFGGFDQKTLANIGKALTYLKDNQAAKLIAEKQSQIEKIKAEIAALEG